MSRIEDTIAGFGGYHEYQRFEPVAKHSKEIRNASYKILPNTLVDSFILRAGTIIGGIYTLDSITSGEMDFLFRLSGVAGVVFESVADAVSTIKGIKEIWDPRYFEYGLDEHFGETMPLCPRNPTVFQLLLSMIPIKGAFAAFAYQHPSLGYGMAASGIQTYLHNTKAAKRMRVAKNIGDELKDLSFAGANDEELITHLDTIVAAPDLHLTKVGIKANQIPV
ncbi:MAG: hypothetical protein AABX25_04545 [Nanoarchaeota archaeon]